jgi:post-segregation antitoxin (ccd killing protein)
MGRRPKGAEPVRPLSVKVSESLYADYADVARAKDIDLSALVKQVLTDARPGLLKWLRQHKAALSNGENGR